MANKKFLDEEMLDDEQLDNVAGGNAQETSDDSKFFNSLNGSCGRHDENSCFSEKYDEEIKNAWAAVGIKCDTWSWVMTSDPNAFRNSYYLNGQQITQEEARQHAMKVTGHYMNRSDWDY